MQKEREVEGAEADEILSAAQVFSHEMPKVSKNNILRIHPLFMTREEDDEGKDGTTDNASRFLLKAVIIYFDVEQLMQNIIQFYRINVALLEKAQNGDAHKESNNNLGTQLQNKLRKTGIQLFKNVENRLKGTVDSGDEPVDPEVDPDLVSPPPLSPSRPNPLEVLGPLSLRASKILISAIHAWHLESNLDQFLVEKLNLKMPRWPILFGLIRRNVGMLDLPVEPAIQKNGCESNFFSNSDLTAENGQAHYDVNGHWTRNEDMTNIHLVAITSLSNAIMSLPEEILGGIEGRQCWSNLMTLHCALLPATG